MQRPALLICQKNFSLQDGSVFFSTLELTMTIAEFFNNQSIGAFLGAFAAFLLVAANDWRRERRKLKTLRAEMEVLLGDAEAKLDTARRMRSMLRDENRLTTAPVLRFNTSFTRQLSGEVLHLLTRDQRRAVEALCYTMEAIDCLFTEANEAAKAIYAMEDVPERIKLATTLLDTWKDIVSNLKRLMDMFETYLAGRFTDLLERQYNAADYDEA